MNYRIKAEMVGSAFIRVARIAHHCNGGHDGVQRTKCTKSITKSEQYVEFVGESHPYESGKRYHMACAEQQGIVERL